MQNLLIHNKIRSSTSSSSLSCTFPPKSRLFWDEDVPEINFVINDGSAFVEVSGDGEKVNVSKGFVFTLSQKFVANHEEWMGLYGSGDGWSFSALGWVKFNVKFVYNFLVCWFFFILNLKTHLLNYTHHKYPYRY